MLLSFSELQRDDVLAGCQEHESPAVSFGMLDIKACGMLLKTRQFMTYQPQAHKLIHS
ncbi:hypothetical protein [Rhizobium bangladeshense]|uniref:hypothetical protein n=1 Tax=Rhizobium bangladeshense TaxID=1138189 RepID=UPI001C82A0D8|nr:hypothetical protein [Rhizobium bangladeshense]MBX4899318.1 hypothetical protein [Rhizobium bangladeshense]MBY3597586.1 hypothetical protein [Rhizobium bangladeshense]MBY3617531.1 hypothetical protein [Rhizobium bangladeshense]